MDPQTQILEANSEFTKSLYRALAKKKGNIFVSPLSIHSVLSMLHQGAQNETAQVLARTLNIPDVPSTAQGYRSAIRRLESTKHVTLLLANKIYGVQEFQKDFQKSLEKNFGSGVEVLDLEDPKRAAENVNKWVEDKTHNKIKNIVTERLFNENLCLLLINTIYFKGEWESKFGKSITQKEEFYLEEGNTVEVEMMHQKEYHWYKEDQDLGAQILEIPYKGRVARMMIILPKNRNIKQLEDKLVTSDLKNVGRNLQMTEVCVSLPKFKMEETIELKDVLNEMGLKPIFDRNKANFKGIITTFDPTRNLYVSEVIQKAFIEVNEDGTEATAATRAAMFLTCARSVSEPTVFKVDHPAIFLLLTRHGSDDSATVLFFGRLSHPQF